MTLAHKDHQVDILNAEGKVVGHKPRDEVNKHTDIYHTVFVLLVSPHAELVLSKIPARKDLPNLYANMLGMTAATIRRTHETPEKAAFRCAKHELNIDKPNLRLMGEGMYRLDNNHKTFATAYYISAGRPINYSLTDIESMKTVSVATLRAALRTNPEQFAPTFKAIWKDFQDTLPVT